MRLWTNCLEDVRIEAKEIKAGAFPALRTVLAGMCNHLHAKALPGMTAKGITIGARVQDAPFVASVLGRIANGYLVPAAHALRSDMSPAVATLVNHALSRVGRCRTTDAVRLLAEELVRMERQSQPQQEQPQDGPGAPQEPQDGQDGPGAPQEPQDGQDGPGAPQEPQDGQDGPGAPQEPQDGQDGPGAPQEPQDGHAGDGSGPPALSGDADLTDTVAKVADRAGIDVGEYRFNHAHALTVARNTVSQEGASYGNHAAGRELDQLLPRNSVLHGQIGRLLVSEEVHRRTHHESSGRLDRRALVRMRAGAVDVYSRRDDTPGMDTALLVLIDGSSSMDATVVSRHPGALTYTTTSRMGIARTTAWHIARAAEAANAKVAIAVFHTRPDHIDPRGRKLGTNGLTGAQLTVVKPWSVPVADRAGVLARVQASAWTPLSPAIMAGADMLAAINATRHILMVLTDGECDYGNDGVRAACQLADDQGVETVGIGMACAAVIDAFPPRYSVNVTDLTQLASTGLGVLVTMLEDANPRGGDD